MAVIVWTYAGEGIVRGAFAHLLKFEQVFSVVSNSYILNHRDRVL